MRSGDSGTSVTRFGLAPMSTDMRVLTLIVLALPFVLFLGALQAFGPVRSGLLGVTVLVVALYASDPTGLRIRRPPRARTILAREIAEATALSRHAFRREFGWGMRIGAGGRWGGFGWLYTRKGLLDLYISRTDRLVLLRLRTGRPLLVTPEGDERFVAALRAVAAPDVHGRPVGP